MQPNNGINPYSRNSLYTAEVSTIRNLEKTSEFMVALNSEVGKLLFQDLIKLMDEKFKLIYEEKSTERDRAIFSACKYIGERWNKIIDVHEKSITNLKVIKEQKELRNTKKKLVK